MSECDSPLVCMQLREIDRENHKEDMGFISLFPMFECVDLLARHPLNNVWDDLHFKCTYLTSIPLKI